LAIARSTGRGSSSAVIADSERARFFASIGHSKGCSTNETGQSAATSDAVNWKDKILAMAALLHSKMGE
jgi:hypothetical protein